MLTLKKAIQIWLLDTKDIPSIHECKTKLKDDIQFDKNCVIYQANSSGKDLIKIGVRVDTDKFIYHYYFNPSISATGKLFITVSTKITSKASKKTTTINDIRLYSEGSNKDLLMGYVLLEIRRIYSELEAA